MGQTLGWQFEERQQIYCYPEGQNLAIDNVELNDGTFIKVLIAPLNVDDDKFVQSLADDSGHESNVKLIAHLCVGWGEKEFVTEEDISAELEAVRDVAGAIGQFFPKGARVIKGRKKPADNDIPTQRKQLPGKSRTVAELKRLDSAANDRGA